MGILKNNGVLVFVIFVAGVYRSGADVLHTNTAVYHKALFMRICRLWFCPFIPALAAY